MSVSACRISICWFAVATLSVMMSIGASLAAQGEDATEVQALSTTQAGPRTVFSYGNGKGPKHCVARRPVADASPGHPGSIEFRFWKDSSVFRIDLKSWERRYAEGIPVSVAAGEHVKGATFADVVPDETAITIDLGDNLHAIRR